MNLGCCDALIALSSSARAELAWGLEKTLNANGIPVHLSPLDMIVKTDASKIGWGAVHQSLQTNGRWFQQGVQRIQRHEGVEGGPNNYFTFSAESAFHTDAFTINWTPLQSYASPPII